MKSFKDYLTESKKTYDFKIKIAGALTADCESNLKGLLNKYQVVGFKKSATTPVQSLPLDFPRLTNEEVNIWEVSLDYPVASYELANYLGGGLKINEQNIVVRRPGEPSEEYQEPPATYEGTLLGDSTYKEAPNVDSNDFYGDKYNSSLIKTLNNDLKAQNKARGEVIPSEGKGQTTNDLPQGNTSPIKQTDYDPRKK
jgi:hypothetical protein